MKFTILASILVLLFQWPEVSQEIGDPFTKGPASAAVKIEVFNDYQCPPCGTFNETLKKILNDYGDSVQIVFRNYPLTSTHINALQAAQAAEAANLQGKFREMIELLYMRHAKWAESEQSGATFVAFARELDLNESQFISDMSSARVKARIERDIERAKHLQVKGTPTVFVNEKDVSWGQVLNAVQVLFNPKS